MKIYLQRCKCDWFHQLEDCSKLTKINKEVIKINFQNIGNSKKKKYGVYKLHPNFSMDYFKHIDMKEKAYWLGWLFAEGWMSRQKTGGIRFGVEIDKKEEILINRFTKAINFNIKYKRYPKGTKKVQIRLMNKPFTDNLINQGFIIGRNKSKNIELPDLSSRELYLAFLLGYYDGDGKIRTTRINSGSKKILEQIKNKFKLTNKISMKKSGGAIDGREVHGICYEMGLGRKLFNEMLDNHELSLPRKRIKINANIGRQEKLEENAKRLREFKQEISKEELTKLVWQIPRTKIEEKYKLPDKSIKKLCNELNIEIPPLGYWSKKRFLENSN